jgi:dihydrodipicolinate synthase/N-acetylneuraminate lyase
MLTRDNYRGVFAYPPTPFTPQSLLLDEDAVRENIRKLAALGASGVVMAGTSGEFYALSTAEYQRLGTIMQEECARADILSVMGTSGLSTQDAIERTTQAMDLGLDGAICLQPFYSTLTTEELLRFWRDLATACPKIGLIIYHFEWVRQDYSLETFKALADLPNIVGSKEAHWDFNKWLKFSRTSPLVHMSATDIGWLVELHKHHAVGVGSMHVCLVPHLVSQILDHCAAGNYLAAERALMPFTDFFARTKLGSGRPHVFPPELGDWQKYSSNARHKALVDAFGFLRAGPPRLPSLPVPEGLGRHLRDYIESHYPELIPPANWTGALGRPLWRPAAPPPRL